MSFPNTRHTLIRRIVQRGDNADWSEFLADYWGPVCRFARWAGNLSHEDAEDVGSQVFEAMLKNRLLERWTACRSAKLRTLICAVVRNVISNRARVESGRARIVRDHGGELDRYLDWSQTELSDAPQDQIDAFYAAWVDDVLQAAVENLMNAYNRAGKGDYFRVLYGRLCEELPMPEIAAALQIKLTAAENYYRHARQRLSEELQSKVRAHVERYSEVEDIATEVASEWARIGDHLQEHGGLEAVIRRNASTTEPAFHPPRKLAVRS
jgi:RNA polymerase sigma factor (sigma-70 family)